jgi:hypothetical protein
MPDQVTSEGTDFDAQNPSHVQTDSIGVLWWVGALFAFHYGVFFVLIELGLRRFGP